MKIIFYFFYLLSFISYGQKEYSKWYFGSKAALDFISGSPLSITGCTMITFEGCVSIADSSGNLLFYSDGATVWDKNNAIMSNGSGLMGDPSTTQSSFVVKKPGQNSSLYYLFSLNDLGTGSLGYSVIDMSLAAGFGSVTTKNDTLATNMTEKLHGTLHCNGTDVWVLAHKYNSDQFYSYLVTAAGVNTVPVISTVGSMHTVTNGTVNGSWGVMKFSPNGKKIGLVLSGSKTVELLDFNPANGQVYNSLIPSTTFSGNPYGCEFSPDGSKYYVTEYYYYTNLIHQWDLCAGSQSAIVNSHQIIASITTSNTNSFGAAQIAPDGKIYIAPYGAYFMSVINNPNIAGSACGAIFQGPSLTSNSCLRGLPNHMSSSHRQKAQMNAAVSGTCGMRTFSYTPPLYLCSQVSDTVSSVEWHFNDPSSLSNTSSASSPQHLYTQNGNYTVTLIVNYACYTDTLKQVLTINDFPNLVVTGKQSVCKGEKMTYTLSGANSYSLNGILCATTVTAQPSSNTVYTISGTGSGTAACIAKKTVSLTVLPCTNVPDINEQTALRIYPNPSYALFIFETDRVAEISICDMNGHVVLSKIINPGKTSIDIGQQAAGIYFVRAKNNVTSYSFKLIKEP